MPAKHRFKRIHVTKKIMHYGLVGWQYAERDGSAVLKEKTSWRKINGFFVTIGSKRLWITFRRAQLRR
jgi:hypothetical protein